MGTFFVIKIMNINMDWEKRNEKGLNTNDDI